MIKIFFLLIIIIAICSCQKEIYGPAVPAATDSLNTNPVVSKWQKIAHNMGAIENILFLTPAKGFCAAEYGLFSSLDSGKTWSLITGGTGAVNDVYFYNSHLGYYVGEEATGYTVDGGNTWVSAPINFRLPHRIFFSAPSTGYVTTDNGLFKTTDSGKIWKQIQAGLIGPGIYFSDSLHGWFTAIGSVIYTTPDGGNTFAVNRPFSNTSPGDYFTTILFTDAQHGWVNNAVNNYIFRTINKGDSWEKINVGKFIFEIHFINNSTGYIATGDGVAKSTDGGSSWNQILKAGPVEIIRETFFLNEKTGWAAGDANSFLYRTVP